MKTNGQTTSDKIKHYVILTTQKDKIKMLIN